MVLGAPLALAAALVSARLWLVGPAWIALVAALLFVDVLLAAERRRRTPLSLTAPGAMASGQTWSALLRAAFPHGGGSGGVEFAVDLDDRLTAEPAAAGPRSTTDQAGLPLTLTALRRGEGGRIASRPAGAARWA